MTDRDRSMVDFFERMELEYRSSSPWLWPRSMTLGELDWFRHAWHRFEPMHGVYLSDSMSITGRQDGEIRTLTANRWDYDYSESIGHEIPPWRQGDCWAVRDGCVVKFR